MLFRDRRDAGQQLATALQSYRDQQALIMAVPRGGVVVAAPVVAALNGELDLIIPRKVGLPANPELALAAVAPDGMVLYNWPVMGSFNLTAQNLKELVDRELQEIHRRLEVYRGDRKEPQLQGRLVILIDDGIATGLTIEAALQSLARNHPARLVLAVPVAPPETIARLRPLVDDLRCLYTPEPFYAVGQFYTDFQQVTDAEVQEILAEFGPRG
ncbi:MAG: putative phosphoribosyl transferase [Clostridia bacterium]|nr:putative phosphoribosyl transferase [Clostridia bacterium]